MAERQRPLEAIIGGTYYRLRPGPRGPPLFTYYLMSRAAQGVSNFLTGVLQTNLVDKLMGEMGKIEDFPIPLSEQAAKLPLDKLPKQVKLHIINEYKHIFTAWKAGIGAGLGSSYSQAIENFYNTGLLEYAYGTLQYHTSVLPRMRRYWNKQYTPTVPDERMAWILLKRGEINEAVFKEFAAYEGWDKKGINYLQATWKTLPNERAAFRMMMRGSIKYKDYKKLVVANGWDEWWHTHLYDLFEWRPNSVQAFHMRARGIIKTPEMRALFRSQGFRPYWDDKLPDLFKPIPTLSQAARMYLRSAATPDEYLSMGTALGYDPETATKLIANWLNWPSTREAFYMHRRDIIDLTSRDKIYQAQGYTSSWWPLISENYQHIPNPLNAFKMMMRGDLSRKEFDTYIYQNGWDPGFAAKFYSLYQNIPTSREAFFMWVKGLLSLAERNDVFKAYGWDAAWYSKLIQNYYYVPTLYDLFRLADYVEVDSIWATDVMKRRGLKDSDIAKLLPMITIRALRDEIRRQVFLWLNRRGLGWITADQLEAALDTMLGNGYIQATEKTLLLEEGELKYEDELMQERINVIIYKFRTNQLSEADALSDLLALGIVLEKANLMIEEQKARGYFGY